MQAERSTRRVAVTGGSGIAGRSAVRHLLEQGYDVVVLDQVNRTDAELVEVDVRDYDAVVDALDGI